jgi:hypothetical protein
MTEMPGTNIVGVAAVLRAETDEPEPPNGKSGNEVGVEIVGTAEPPSCGTEKVFTDAMGLPNTVLLGMLMVDTGEGADPTGDGTVERLDTETLAGDDDTLEVTVGANADRLETGRAL